MLKKAWEWLKRRGSSQCLWCGTWGHHSWRKIIRRFKIVRVNGKRTKLSYEAVLKTEGLCSHCFDVRSEQWAKFTEGAFNHVFEQEVKEVGPSLGEHLLDPAKLKFFKAVGALDPAVQEKVLEKASSMAEHCVHLGPRDWSPRGIMEAK